MHGHRHHRDPYWFIEIAVAWLMGARHGRAAHAPPRAFADPSIEACAVALASEVWDDMNRRRIAGERWYVARERALAPRLRLWNRTYGAKCAARAHEIVLGLDPAKAPGEVLEAEAHRISQILVDATIARKGRLSWLDAFFLNRWGVPF